LRVCVPFRLKPFTKEKGDPPRRIPFFLTATLVDRTS
jgi:hypothetical protein